MCCWPDLAGLRSLSIPIQSGHQGAGFDRLQFGPQDPFRRTKTVDLGRQVHGRINQGARRATVQRHLNVRCHSNLPMPLPSILRGQETRELKNHVRPRSHLSVLARMQVRGRVDFPPLARLDIDHREPRPRLAIVQLHPPRKSMPFVRPIHVARIKEMPQRQQDLDGNVNGQSSDYGDPRRAGPARRRRRPAGF